MHFLSDEDLIVSSNENKVILTNLRIHLSDREWGRSYSNTLFLEDISSIEVRYRSNIIFLGLGILGLLAWLGVATNESVSTQQSMLYLGVALVLLVLYWLSRKHVISISPNGGKSINFEVSNMDSLQIEDFVGKVQEAKLSRLKEIKTTYETHS